MTHAPFTLVLIHCTDYVSDITGVKISLRMYNQAVAESMDYFAATSFAQSVFRPKSCYFPVQWS